MRRVFCGVALAGMLLLSSGTASAVTITFESAPAGTFSSYSEAGVTFTWKDYRIEGPDRYKTMTLPTHEFIRRFLTHVLPKGLHRIRHYGLFANGNRAANIARARELLAVPSRPNRPRHPRPQPTTNSDSACCRVRAAAAAAA